MKEKKNIFHVLMPDGKKIAVKEGFFSGRTSKLLFHTDGDCSGEFFMDTVVLLAESGILHTVLTKEDIGNLCKRLNELVDGQSGKGEI